MTSKPDSEEDLAVMKIIEEPLDDLVCWKLAPAPKKLLPALGHCQEIIPSGTSSLSEEDAESTVEQTSETPSESDTASTVERALNTPSEADPASIVELPLDAPDEVDITIKVKLTENHNFTIMIMDESKGKMLEFLVSDSILAASSQYFKVLFRMGDSGVQVDQQGESPVTSPVTSALLRTIGHTYIQCRGDPLALHSILGIIHFCPDENLFDIDFSLLTNIAFVAEEFSWNKALLPWSTVWLTKYSQHALDPGFENWLYVSKVFGSNERVDELVKLLARTCAVSKYDTSKIFRNVSDTLQELNTTLWPPEIKDRILDLRRQRIEHLYASIQILTTVLRSNRTARSSLMSWLNYAKGSELRARLCSSPVCRPLAFGSLVQSIDSREGGFDPEFSSWSGSADGLEKEINKITFNTLAEVILGHKCALQHLKTNLTKCLEDETLLDWGSRTKKIFEEAAVA
ncbi:uncharacterized protein DFL_004346 [Arthrobotrys flagrans]|uniref:BTB domain-containing protein n=1 Tax=Arthrobotrys flagrans TaxID=97331 RepID=A0A437A4E6_ARTFL|nr:hypothetical protein DFL_004346 [Arthrobotrys flagrans]